MSLQCLSNTHRRDNMNIKKACGVDSRRTLPGMLQKTNSEIKNVFERCQVEVDRIFKTDEYKNVHNRLLTGLKKVQEAEFTRLQKHVERNPFFIVRTSFGFVLVP